jgi:DNA-binding NtrC family response regulator
MEKSTILIGAADNLLRQTLKSMVQRLGFEPMEASGTNDIVRSLRGRTPALIIAVSSWEEGGDGLEGVREIRRQDPGVPIILVAARSSEKTAIEALRIGVSDYLKLPVLPEELAASIGRSLPGPGRETAAPRDSRPGLEEPVSKGETAEREDIREGQIVGRSPALLGLKTFAKEVAATDCTVLITGETGTGKELAANLIHRNSPRARKPFVVINCAAIPDTLLESELFGHEKGAFTGAYSRREGALRAAEGGTVFLDEIGDMNPYAQTKLLRIMETREICRVGGNRSIPLNVRFVTATNQDLEKLIKEGKFRSDLYFRLNVARIHLPPLRERKEDIVPLLEYFRLRLNRKFGKQVAGFTEEAVQALLEYEWPGNIRELKNLLEATFIRARGTIDLKDLPELFQQRLREAEGISEDERTRLLAALFSTSWNKTKAAQKLHWSRMTLYRKMQKYRINPTEESQMAVNETGYR